MISGFFFMDDFITMNVVQIHELSRMSVDRGGKKEKQLTKRIAH